MTDPITPPPSTGPPYWVAIWFVIITGSIATVLHLVQLSPPCNDTKTSNHPTAGAGASVGRHAGFTFGPSHIHYGHPMGRQPGAGGVL